MHSSAILNLEKFFSIYLKNFDNPKILDFGSQSLSDHIGAKVLLDKMNINYEYTGVDIEKGNNVDIVLEDPYSFKEIPDAAYDVIISTSVFEHVEFFWLTYLEILRILKPNGVITTQVGSQDKKPEQVKKWMDVFNKNFGNTTLDRVYIPSFDCSWNFSSSINH